jgi:uncharacterized membrane protein YozB (DUF420 family)
MKCSHPVLSIILVIIYGALKIARFQTFQFTPDCPDNVLWTGLALWCSTWFIYTANITIANVVQCCPLKFREDKNDKKWALFHFVAMIIGESIWFLVQLGLHFRALNDDDNFIVLLYPQILSTTIHLIFFFILIGEKGIQNSKKWQLFLKVFFAVFYGFLLIERLILSFNPPDFRGNGPNTWIYFGLFISTIFIWIVNIALTHCGCEDDPDEKWALIHFGAMNIGELIWIVIQIALTFVAPTEDDDFPILLVPQILSTAAHLIFPFIYICKVRCCPNSLSIDESDIILTSFTNTTTGKTIGNQTEK